MSCDSCPYRQAEERAGRPWGPEQERIYCHGGTDPETKKPDQGCAVAWRVWGGISYYIEEISLQAEGKPAPGWWVRDHWRTYVRIKRLLELVQGEQRKKESPHGH